MVTVLPLRLQLHGKSYGCGYGAMVTVTALQVRLRRYGYGATVAALRLRRYGYGATVTALRLRRYGYGYGATVTATADVKVTVTNIATVT
eukprot:1378966-Amorphochlora_amoeboformis.AAC.1